MSGELYKVTITGHIVDKDGDGDPEGWEWYDLIHSHHFVTEPAYFFSKEQAKQMAFNISEGIPEIEEHMAVEQVTTFEDSIKSDYFD